LAVVGSFQLKPAFVNQPVVMAAQQHEVFGGRFAAIDPVFDVMALEVAFVIAAGKCTAAVARLQRICPLERIFSGDV
jgi:hypothetical protein